MIRRAARFTMRVETTELNAIRIAAAVLTCWSLGPDGKRERIFGQTVRRLKLLNANSASIVNASGGLAAINRAADPDVSKR